MNVLAAVAAGSAPGVLPGRGVAGCRASGPDIADGEHCGDTGLPFGARADRPADRICGPQKRLRRGRMMVVHRVEVPVDADKCVGDSCTVP